MPDSSESHLSLHVGDASEIQYIPTGRIRVLNPRTRNLKIFRELVENISSVGLKRPITVCVSGEDDQGSKYNLLCGQGRLEALMMLGENEAPCIVVEASEADGYLISLVENLARRKHTNRDLLNAISVMSNRGYNSRQIADKTALDTTYINGVLLLLRQGEDRLISGVEKGWLPMTIAIEISRASDADVQMALTDAYEAGTLKGEQMISARRLIDKRRSLGKTFRHSAPRAQQPTTVRSVLSTYQNEVRRQQLMIKKATISEHRLLFITSALRNLFKDSHFRTLLRAEGIQDMPKPLGDKIHGDS
ncbi:plasmid partitioning protein RepB C-terminal domain-containing protein [Pseudomonas japonica]|uniref:plasmid partitioning protein RepB C-terminal domain-containing protein n=1 Tax=Pseudomonas japonica TaxID=256466 RepID=UPI0015E40739|nr:plasmid partitioning protein RepB C-terminal domain-containing protein [Pseudomonas japonica]MBA1245866.1 ParB N-terminal domain-containing protein [Pseudomonas japonica]